MDEQTSSPGRGSEGPRRPPQKPRGAKNARGEQHALPQEPPDTKLELNPQQSIWSAKGRAWIDFENTWLKKAVGMDVEKMAVHAHLSVPQLKACLLEGKCPLDEWARRHVVFELTRSEEMYGEKPRIQRWRFRNTATVAVLPEEPAQEKLIEIFEQEARNAMKDAKKALLEGIPSDGRAPLGHQGVQQRAVLRLEQHTVPTHGGTKPGTATLAAVLDLVAREHEELLSAESNDELQKFRLQCVSKLGQDAIAVATRFDLVPEELLLRARAAPTSRVLDEVAQALRGEAGDMAMNGAEFVAVLDWARFCQKVLRSPGIHDLLKALRYVRDFASSFEYARLSPTGHVVAARRINDSLLMFMAALFAAIEGGVEGLPSRLADVLAEGDELDGDSDLAKYGKRLASVCKQAQGQLKGELARKLRESRAGKRIGIEGDARSVNGGVLPERDSSLNPGDFEFQDSTRDAYLALICVLLEMKSHKYRTALELSGFTGADRAALSRKLKELSRYRIVEIKGTRGGWRLTIPGRAWAKAIATRHQRPPNLH